ncbi:MAG: CBS domain-containing protein [Deltaproteobacteria bacterium]|nr:CBS domain-containing protein [Deltaproteobacteria bacterium]
MKRTKEPEQVSQRMSAPVTINSDESLQTAIELLQKHNIRELPVMDHGCLVGIVTDRDLREIAPSYPLFRDQQEIRYHLQNLKVSKAMTVDPVTINPQAPLLEAATLLYTFRIGALPVMQDKKLVGIISVTDILRAFIEQNQ